MQICLFEDPAFSNFSPLTLTRPVFLLRCGILPLYKRVGRFFPSASFSFAVRNDIAPFVAETMSEIPVNIIKHGGQPLLFLNGRLRHPGNLAELLTDTRLISVLKSGDETVAVFFPATSAVDLPPVITPDAYVNYLDSHSDRVQEVRTTATLYNYLWDFVNDIDTEISADFNFLLPSFTKASTTIHEGVFLINVDQIQLGEGVEIFPASVLDASKGPIVLGKNVRVESHAAIVGPCYIGDESVVLAGKIVGSSIGPVCRVGGEVEESLFHGYVNKYHAGFIGHSVVGSWVNFGAMTTNSDLKNNYSTIRVSVNGTMTDSGSIKVGSFIGDHTKFGIGTLLNTGVSIGAACNIFGGSFVTDKEVPSFSWGASGNWERYALDKALETATRTLGRRKCILSEREKAVLRLIFDTELSDSGVLSW